MQNKNQLSSIEKFINTYIVKMIPGTYLEKIQVASKRSKNSARFSTDHYQIKIYCEDCKHYFSLKKNKPFEKNEYPLILGMLEDFLDSVAKNLDYYQEVIFNEIQEKHIAKILHDKNWEIIKNIIDLYKSWSAQTYEGNRISHTIGINLNKSTPSDENILLLAEEDFLKIVGSSYDSILTVEKNGRVHGIEKLTLGSSNKNIIAPISFSHVASWATDEKIAISLTRNGDILLFKNKALCFAKRRGTWRYFPHKLILKDNLQRKGHHLPRETRLAIYLTSLDVAFTRGGACLGVIKPKTKLDSVVKL